MKRAVILHGTSASPDANWFPWLKQQLETVGYEVWVPLLPENSTPNRHRYNDFLFNSDWDFANNLIIGHSSGAVSILNLLADERCPHITAGVLAGAWARLNEADYTDAFKSAFGGSSEIFRRFQDLFPPERFDFQTIKQKAGKLLFVHGENDPFCPVEQAKWLAEQTGGDMEVVPGRQHFSASMDPAYSQFPKLIELLQTRRLI